MIGFLRKDLYALTSMYKKNLLLVLALYTVMLLVMRATFLLYMLIFLMGFYGMSAISLDQSCGWDRYARTLPASAAQIIGARYVVMLLAHAAGAAFALLLGGLSSLLWREPFAPVAFGAAVVTALALACTGLMLPASYRWGVEKARATFLVLFMAAFLVPSVLGRSEETFRLRLEALSAWVEAHFVPTAALALAAGLAVFAAGYFISCRVYRKKEF